MFQLAHASLVGADHRKDLHATNGQDALCVLPLSRSPFGAGYIALVADGCGSGSHTEVGAKIGVRLLVQALVTHMEKLRPRHEGGRLNFKDVLERARQDVLARLRILALDLGGSLTATVNDYFLFTIVGAIVTEQYSCFFSRGDGLVVVGGEEIWIEPDEGNAPVYLGYALVDSSLHKHRPDALRFDIQRCMATDRLDHFLVGTDGLAYLSGAAHLPLPGKQTLVGPLSQFWSQDKYFTNPDALRRRLALINRHHTRPDWEGRRLLKSAGHLKDDVALIIGRRIP